MDKIKKDKEVFDLVSEDGIALDYVCVGINWDAIEKHGVYADRKIKIDMDMSCILFDEHEHILDVVYYYQMTSKDGSILHTGDDSKNLRNEKNLDNEVIKVNFVKINKKCKRLVFVLNSYDKEDFASTPHMKIRVYDGKPNRPDEIYATADIINNHLFDGSLGMLIAEIYKRNDEIWTFSAIFELTSDKDLEETIHNLKERIK